MPARSSAALIATPPSSIALMPANAPDNLPMGVRAEPTITEPDIGGLLTCAPPRSVYVRVVLSRYRPVASQRSRPFEQLRGCDVGDRRHPFRDPRRRERRGARRIAAARRSARRARET